MSLIKLESEVNYLKVTYEDSTVEYWRYSSITHLKYDVADETIIFVFVNNTQHELEYWNIESINNPGYPMESVQELFVFLYSILKISQLALHIMDLDTSMVIKLADYYFIKDISGNGNNVRVSGVGVAKFDSVGSYIDFGNFTNDTVFEYTIIYEPKLLNTLQAIYGNACLFAPIAGRAGFGVFQRQDNKIGLQFYYDGSNNISIISTVILDTSNKFTITFGYDGIKGYLSVNNETQINTSNFTPINNFNSTYNYVAGVRSGISNNYFLSGLLHSIVNSNLKVYFQERQGSTILDYSGNDNSGTVMNADLEDFWSETSDYAKPWNYLLGETKKLVCESSGTTAHLVNPDENNLGSELVVNGEFDADSYWTKGTGWSIDNGTANCNGEQIAVTSLYQNAGLVLGKTYALTYTLLNYSAGSVSLDVGGSVGIDRIADGTYVETLTVVTTNVNAVFNASADFIGSIDNVSVREVPPIDLTTQENVWEFDFKKNTDTNSISMYFSDTLDFNNWFSVVFNSAEQVGCYKTGALPVFLSSTGYFSSSTQYRCRVVLSPTMVISVYLKEYGGEYVQVGSGQVPTLDFRFIILDCDLGDEISNLKFNGKIIDAETFINQTGSYKVAHILGSGDGLTDIEGNELEYKPNGIWDSGEQRFTFPASIQISDKPGVQGKLYNADVPIQNVDCKTIVWVQDDDIEITQDDKTITGFKVNYND